MTAEPLPDPSADSLAARPASITVRAVMVGARLDTAGLERADSISTVPLAFPVSGHGHAVLFRMGIVVLFGLTPVEEDTIIRSLAPRISGALAEREEETAAIAVAADRDDHVPPGGPIMVRALGDKRILVIADALAKSVALAHGERGVAKVLERIEPLAQVLAANGRVHGSRRSIRKLIGETLLVQQRMASRIAAEEKPDILWENPELERLYQRLDSEYELSERARMLAAKLRVIEETARALADLLDTEHSLRLEMAIVALIVFEILITFYELFVRTAR